MDYFSFVRRLSVSHTFNEQVQVTPCSMEYSILVLCKQWKFALFTKGSKLPLNQGFQNRILVTTVSRQTLDISEIMLKMA